jgi:hypothetical protein
MLLAMSQLSSGRRSVFTVPRFFSRYVVVKSVVTKCNWFLSIGLAYLDVLLPFEI